MQKHFRARIGNLNRFSRDRAVFAEALNPHFGFLYTVKKTLIKCKTRYQDLRLVDTDEFGKVLLLDNVTQVAEKNEYQYLEPMVHPALCSHPKPQSVLVIGGGDGGIIREVFKYPCVKSVVLAELDAGVIAFSKKYLPMIHGGAFDDPRLTIAISDGRRYVEEHPAMFDVVIMDMTDPGGPSAMLYTKDFFLSVGRSLRDRSGIFVMHSESPVARPGAFSCIQKTLGSAFSHAVPLYMYIQMYAVFWSVTLSSDGIDASRNTPASIDRKLKRYGIRNLQAYSGAIHAAMRTPFPYIEKILAQKARIITDAKPDFPDDFPSSQP